MYDQVVKCQRAGLCLSEHFLINDLYHGRTVDARDGRRGVGRSVDIREITATHVQRQGVKYSTSYKKKKTNLFFAQKKTNIKMNKHVNKVRQATGRAEAITAGRQQNKQQYLIIIQLM